MRNHNIPRAVLAVVLCMLLITPLAGCGNKSDTASTTAVTKAPTSDVFPAEDESAQYSLLDAIYKQNRLDALLLNHKNVERKTVCKDEMGSEVFTATVYGDTNQYAYRDSSGNISVLKNGKESGYDASDKVPYDKTFVHTSYSSYAKDIRNHIIFTGYESESVISATMSKTEAVVQTKIPMSSIDQTAGYKPGFTFSTDDTCIIEYHMIPYLYEITSMSLYVVRNSGERVDLMEITISYDVPTYQMPGWLTSKLSGNSGVSHQTM